MWMLPLEIKCPEKCKFEEITVQNTDYIVKDALGNYQVSETGPRGPLIMFQVQMQILLSKADRGILFIYSPQNTITIPINLSKALI